MLYSLYGTKEKTSKTTLSISFYKIILYESDLRTLLTNQQTKFDGKF
jgi:hypothetical protein